MYKSATIIAALMLTVASPALANCCGDKAKGGAKDGAKSGMQCMDAMPMKSGSMMPTGDKAEAAPTANQSTSPPTGSHSDMDMTKPGAAPAKMAGCGCCGEKKS